MAVVVAKSRADLATALAGAGYRVLPGLLTPAEVAACNRRLAGYAARAAGQVLREDGKGLGSVPIPGLPGGGVLQVVDHGEYIRAFCPSRTLNPFLVKT